MATISVSRTVPMAADVSRMDQGTTHPFTCNTCQVAFRNIDLQKGHMRSDWHRYNLKRRVASLPPISSEVFTEKVLQSRAEVTAQTDKASFEMTCEACSKTYYSENSYKNHISSKNHKMRAAALASRGPAAIGRTKADDEVSSVMSSTFSLGEPASEAKSEVDSDAEEEFNEVVEGIKQAKIEDTASPVDRPANPHLSAADQHKEDHPVEDAAASEQPESSGTATPTQPEADATVLKQCLFCNYESPTPALNATHMERIHGMFIPEKQYLVDLEGLLGSLRRRVFELNECLMCGKMRSNTFAVQTHMRDKGHCQIPYTTEEEQLEIGEFYDFRSTYSDGDDWDTEDEEEEEEEGAGGAKLGGKREAKVEVVEGEEGEGEGGDEEGWETDSSASSLDSDDLHAVPGEGHYHQYERLASHRHHSRDDPRPHRQADGFHAHSRKGVNAVYYDEYELHLPSGRSVGHRSLNRYFRQNLHNYPTPEERQQQLLLEAAGGEEGEDAEMQYDSDGEPRFRRNMEVQLRDRKAHGRHVITRETRGLIGANGIRDVESKEVRKVVEKGRQREVDSYKRAEVVGMKKHFKERHRNPVSYLR
ncbi:C2H2 type zinc-finger-domain-containing protein [Neurospora hispaniola]|uniref:C2H2 type zinc-finger-domain-containing protein n=1 Tax=Neurospora hispaniola TaxID=588809 RepID=A0AAJ0I7X1_9PEZI|nr:C2H2 type zinc-finger-domain-containing protein [Neurospora hispaniola]